MPVDLLYPTPIFVDKTTDENIFVEIQNAVDSETYSYNDYWGKTHELSESGDIIFYHQTNDIDGHLWFENPAVQSEQSLSYTQEVIKYAPQKGKLIMFPGYMKHGVLRNQTQDTRISLSFNIYFPKKTA